MSRMDKSRVCPITEHQPANSDPTTIRTIDKTSVFYQDASNELSNSSEDQQAENLNAGNLASLSLNESGRITPPPKSIMSSPLADVNALIGKYSYQSRFCSSSSATKDFSKVNEGKKYATLNESMPKEAQLHTTTLKMIFDVEGETSKVTKIETTAKHAKFSEDCSSSSKTLVTPNSCNTLASQLTQQILVDSKQEQQQNLKPILKRKDTQETIDSTNASTGSGTSGSNNNLPPPILKKRDSLQEGSISFSLQSFESEELHNSGSEYDLF